MEMVAEMAIVMLATVEMEVEVEVEVEMGMETAMAMAMGMGMAVPALEADVTETTESRDCKGREASSILVRASTTKGEAGVSRLHIFVKFSIAVDNSDSKASRRSCNIWYEFLHSRLCRRLWGWGRGWDGDGDRDGDGDGGWGWRWRWGS